MGTSTKQLSKVMKLMITTNARTKDADDVGLILHSVFRYAEANEERLDLSIVAIGYGVLLDRAELAAAEIALQHADESDYWDGAVGSTDCTTMRLAASQRRCTPKM